MKVRQCKAEEIRLILQKSLSKKTDSSGKYSLESMIKDGICFAIVSDAGKIEGGFIAKNEYPELWILAAAGKSEHDLTQIISDAVQRGGIFKTIAFQTQRKGLVKKAQTLGYQIEGFIMRKKIQ